ncbi:MAG: type III-A CRISPR-associated protein Csm2 [Ignavibacteriales bacterium]|mgnify:CR=1 FL=1|jgi:CRISPR-associated protein, Csm2 family|nr:MAG: type III-A CRISPR-associated protein Csm2 [Ignavibacteriaceae bacterium]MBW7873328.1 type III-A CRISPR-associated protein Csm2 [Ignavibacteria bacterium]MCZ2143065.1 type III-A CRISPR-associated protein Csm2 [Ignavibacteriales bacterium]OQY69881.1 MAG: type III-A CRISPR-associated protein Csm2 [Ignavibacteriales bacterium UTCHB3]MBV6444755.1 hypothetical protein [Ignavibacteriaceae bacterium]
MPLENLNGVKDLSEIKPEDIDSIGKTMGKSLVDREVKTNQLRNFYSSIISIRTKLRKEKSVTPAIERELVLLKPKLAYATGRNKKVMELYNLMQDGIGATVSENVSDKKAALANLISITEAIVAYHKFHGGKDK